MALAELPDLASLAVPGGLVDVAADPAAVAAAAARAEELLAGAEGAEVARLHGYLGNACRLLGRHEDAVAHQERSLALAPDQHGRAVARIRLGEALRCAGRPQHAEAVLAAALRETEAPALHELRDFALQHLGKTLLDEGRVEEAKRWLREALALRLAKRDPALVASTEAALEAAQLARRR